MALSERQVSSLVATAVLLACATVFVLLRCVARISIRSFGLDDWFMLLGQGLFIACCVINFLGLQAGLGLYNHEIGAKDREAARHAFFAFIPVYIVCLLAVKCSICLNLSRIAIHKPMRWAIWGLLTFSTLSAIIALAASLSGCRPLSSAWRDVPGSRCGHGSYLALFGYVLSASAIITDSACSILPLIMLWDLQVHRRVKWTLCVILSLGFLASAATIVRLHFFQIYPTTKNGLYVERDIVLWSIVESAIGIITGSAPSLKPLISKRYGSIFSTQQRRSRITPNANAANNNSHNKQDSHALNSSNFGRRASNGQYLSSVQNRSQTTVSFAMSTVPSRPASQLQRSATNKIKGGGIAVIGRALGGGGSSSTDDGDELEEDQTGILYTREVDIEEHPVHLVSSWDKGQEDHLDRFG